MTNNEFDYNGARTEGLKSAQNSIKMVREFLRGSTYSTDRLVNMMLMTIQEEIDDLHDDTRQMCSKTE
jgi:hypothetical protein